MSKPDFFPKSRNLWIIAIALIALIKVFSLNSVRVETYYSTAIYPQFSRILRILFGWIPFSFGDLLYLITGIWLLWKVINTFKLLFKRKLSWKIVLRKASRLGLLLAFIYILFNLFWGINYNRKGIAYQLHLTPTPYDTSDLLMLQHLLLEKLNASKTTLIQHETIPLSNSELFKRAKHCYHQASNTYPFLDYRYRSVKSSFYSQLGNYLGFTGYYNPLTGEAQVNTSVPYFLQPYITTHEMAHQLGYAKENEANFVGYLAAVNSTDTLFHYSAYFDLYLYTTREVYYFDSLSSRQSMSQLIPQVKNDIEELLRFNREHRSFLEPAITWMYGNYLKMNQQPQGMHSYNEVVGMLIAYYKQYGKL